MLSLFGMRMIISASRRTDIPAFYAEWFINRIRAGYCTVPNPVNPKRISYVSLSPSDVDVIVFWTRNAKPLIKRLAELDRRGFRYYFQYTILANPRIIDPKSPPTQTSIETLQYLADHMGPDRVIWRYDPIVITNQCPSYYHLEKISYIASTLRGYTKRLIISMLDTYKHTEKRMRSLEAKGLRVWLLDGERFQCFIKSIVEIAKANGMEIFSCAEESGLDRLGVASGKCVDDRLIEKVFKIAVTHKKDPHQRPACGCVMSKDIGVYDTCLFNCVYCYATRNLASVKRKFLKHDPKSPSL
jgi:hypothetical protein